MRESLPYKPRCAIARAITTAECFTDLFDSPDSRDSPDSCKLFLGVSPRLSGLCGLSGKITVVLGYFGYNNPSGYPGYPGYPRTAGYLRLFPQGWLYLHV